MKDCSLGTSQAGAGRSAIHRQHERADHKGQISGRDSWGAGRRCEWIVNNVARKGEEIWQLQIILWPRILPKGTVFSVLVFQVCEKYGKCTYYLG